MSHDKEEKKWMYYYGELYYSGPGKGDVYYIIDTDEVEIHLDKKGEILEIRIKNADKYLEPEEIQEIAYTAKIPVRNHDKSERV